MRLFSKQNKHQHGFTLMEIIIATSIFIVVVSSILVMFNFVLKINRKVQSTRQVAQGMRSFTEILSREIRNGRIDYNSPAAQCDPTNYGNPNNQQNQSLAIITHTGDKMCLYLNSTTGQLFMRRQMTTTGAVIEEAINSPNFVINPSNFRFIVRPTSNLSGNVIQPMVTILAQFEVFKGMPEEVILPYQTTISTDVYDIPHQ